MDRYSLIIDFFEQDYMEYLLNNNITMVYFTMNTTTTFLIYKDEIFIFEGKRSIQKAYKFYNVEQSLCSEGIEYYKITKNYLNYMQEDDESVLNGKKFSVRGVGYLLNYFHKGYCNKKFNLTNMENRMFYLLEFCDAVIEHKLINYSNIERTAVVRVTAKMDYIVDVYSIDSFKPKVMSNKFPINKELRSYVMNKEHTTSVAKLGIFFVDAYKDCLSLHNQCGGFLYFAVDDSNIEMTQFKQITLKEIYEYVTNILKTIELPLTITTSSEFLYDVFYKTFDKEIDFILDKTDLTARFVNDLGVLLSYNNYDDYGIQSFCLIIENNYNEISSIIEKISINDYERMLNECLESYKIENLSDDLFDYEDLVDEFEDEIEETDEFELDSKLLS